MSNGSPHEKYKAKEEERKRRANENAPPEWWWLGQRDPIARFTLYVGLFTGGLVIIGALQWCTLQSQYEELVNEQRPWIAAKIIGVKSTLKHEGDSLTLVVRYRVENFGKLPATRVFFYATLTQDDDPTTIKDAVGNACNTIIRNMKSDSAAAGFTLFPTEFRESAFGITDARWTDFSPDKQGRASILVPVCAVYTVAGRQEFHATPAAYILVQNGLKYPDIGHLPSDGIAVVVHPMAQGNVPPN